MRILCACAVILLVGCSSDVTGVEDFRAPTRPFHHRHSPTLADSMTAPRGLVDVNPPHIPPEPTTSARR